MNNSDFTIVLCGDSASGKDTIQHYLIENFRFSKIVTYTTRLPREIETQDLDYHFITNEEFELLIKQDFFAEYDEYSQKRFYGSAKCDYTDGDKIIILTPNGVENIKKTLDLDNIFIVYVKTSLGTRIKRYIDRIGVDKFTFDDKNEICSRVERDFGMFLGIENKVDLVVNGDKDIKEIAEEIINKIKEKIK